MKIIIDTDLLPPFSAMSTAHWPSEQQMQFSKAVDGINSSEWFSTLPDGPNFDKERVANAFAFAAFSHLRRRMQLASDEDLIKDAPGIRQQVSAEGNASSGCASN